MKQSAVLPFQDELLKDIYDSAKARNQNRSCRLALLCFKNNYSLYKYEFAETLSISIVKHCNVIQYSKISREISQ